VEGALLIDQVRLGAEARAEPTIHGAVEAGITFFDSADVYSQGAGEVATGRLVAKFLSRDEAVIATKVHGQMTPGPNGRGLSRKHILAAIDASLRRLGMDHVDLYQIHRWDPHTPIEETMEALHDVVRAGKLYGRSEDFDVIDRLDEVAAERFDTPAQVALAWLLHKPAITAPIVGATRLEHLEEAIAAANLSLSSEEVERLEEPYVTHPVLGHD
jgi:aryl-alcohol dehydrogenase-like predicted oxidoreductase